MSEGEICKIVEFSQQDEFWDYFMEFGFAQAAAFAAYTLNGQITNDGKLTKRCKQVLLNLGKFCKLYQIAGKTTISKDLLK
jgi:hypothetical protein